MVRQNDAPYFTLPQLTGIFNFNRVRRLTHFLRYEEYKNIIEILDYKIELVKI